MRHLATALSALAISGCDPLIDPVDTRANCEVMAKGEDYAHPDVLQIQRKEQQKKDGGVPTEFASIKEIIAFCRSFVGPHTRLLPECFAQALHHTPIDGKQLIKPDINVEAAHILLDGGICPEE